MDIFEEIPVEKWPILQSQLTKSWPLNVAGFYALHFNLKYPKVREALQFKVYCRSGKMDDGFIATTIKGSLEVIIFPLSEDTSNFEEALIESNLINWATEEICIDLVTSKTLHILNKIRTKMGFKIYKVGYLDTYFLDRKTTPFENLKCPSNTHLSSIKKEHIPQINDKWPYKHNASEFYFTTLASTGLSYGLYSDDNILMAWLFINEYNFLCHLYCEEEYRRKGLGSFLMKYVTNEQLRKGNDVYGYVVKGNQKSSQLFVQLGFRNVDDGAYLYVQK